MKKIKFTAFATSKTGERSHGSGETTVSNDVPRQNYPEAVRQDLKRQGYTDVHIDNLTSES
ncbi:hypothetical protein [Streptomyces nigra]|uniref:hypothetical protein n=1 Tax=Streptomyces nigra TaxID=1827580 RepID=UPI00343AF9B2